MSEFLEHLDFFGFLVEPENAHCAFFAAHCDEPPIRGNAHASTFGTVVEIVSFVVFRGLDPFTRFRTLYEVQRCYGFKNSLLDAPTSDSSVIRAAKH